MTETPFNVIKRDDLVPLCPHCARELNEVYVRGKGLGWIEGRNVVYFCPQCMKALGFGQSRMM
jgi:hypothetical protein